VSEERESKIVFKEGDRERVYRGVILEDDGIFITIQRHEGTIKLNKSIVLKIETPSGGVSADQKTF
jgi:hypothetical protein